jgi:deazaflavin-dependent oxidoreductase (nitroreductase family)
MKDSAVKRWSRFHTWLYRATGGVLGRRLVDNDMLLLTTKGRYTGTGHTVPLLYLRDEDKLVVIASYGGRPIDPDWYRNAMADPVVSVQIRSRRYDALARTASSEERREWWPIIESAYGGYDEYQSRTDREIPVVFLEPLEEREHEL